MLTPSDLLHLPYTPDLTEGGISCAIRSLPHTYDRIDSPPYDRLRRMVAGVAMELAFRRYLGEHNIPFEVNGAAPFTAPDRFEVSLGGHRCKIITFLISHRGQIKDMRRDPAIVLKAPALVPSDQFAADGQSEGDIYIFVFLSGLIAASRDDLNKVIQVGQPYYLLHALPPHWRRPKLWRPFGPLALKSESDSPLNMEISGQDEDRGFVTSRLELPPRTRLTLEEPFFSVSSIHVDRLPEARLGLYSPPGEETHLIRPYEWANLWVYGLEILMAGYVSREEFRRCASFIQPGAHVFQYSRTRMKNLALPVGDLKPLGMLFEKVGKWQAVIK